jgi:hypothetical protein
MISDESHPDLGRLTHSKGAILLGLFGLSVSQMWATLQTCERHSRPLPGMLFRNGWPRRRFVFKCAGAHSSRRTATSMGPSNKVVLAN